MAYHPKNNSTDLPAVSSVADVDKLPWGGNHWWDWPIMQHVYKFVGDETQTRSIRKEALERAGYLMTGEDCSKTDSQFDEEVARIKK